MIKCLLCNLEFESILKTHLSTYHGISKEEYVKMFPDAKLHSDERLETIKRSGRKGVVGRLKALKENPEMLEKQREIGRKSIMIYHDRCRANPELEEQRRMRMSETVLSYNISHPEAAAQHGYLGILSQCRNGKGKFISKLEFKFRKILEEMPIDFIYQYLVGKFIVDFYIPSENLCIEIQGKHWHGDVKTPGVDHVVERDQRKKEYILNRGHKLMYVFERDLENSEYVKKLLLENLGRQDWTF